MKFFEKYIPIFFILRFIKWLERITYYKNAKKIVIPMHCTLNIFLLPNILNLRLLIQIY